jgi:hypothetical protein
MLKSEINPQTDYALHAKSTPDAALRSVGDDLEFDRGVLWGTAEALERVKQRAGVPSMPNSPFAYASRSGKPPPMLQVVMYMPKAYALLVALASILS